MARKLYVVRHAKSAWDTNAPSDLERPLTSRGKRDAPRIGMWLRDRGIDVDHVVSSPARRAWQTTRGLCKPLGFDKQRVVRDARVYEASLDDLLTVLADCPATARGVLLTGHNPGLEELVVFLCGRAALPEVEKIMPTAAVAGIDLPDDWSPLAEDCGALEFLMQPRMLK